MLHAHLHLACSHIRMCMLHNHMQRYGKALAHAHYSRQTALLAAYRNAGNAELGMAL